MKKHFFMRGLAAFLALALAFPASVSAESAPSVSAKSAVLMEAGTGRIIWSQNGDEPRAMASTTKIMTALLALEAPEPDAPFQVDADAICVEGTSMGLAEGAQATLRTLAAGMLLASGNDAANAAAVRIDGSIPAFVERMNRRAAEIGMVNTSFETPSGLDGEAHHSTAEDMARLAREALENEDFRAICSQSRMTLFYGAPPAEHTLKNHNRLLREYPGCVGVKTGFTKKAGRCLVTAAEREGVMLICVTLSDPDDWRDHKALLDWGFERVLPVPEKPEQLAIPVTGGREGFVIASSGSSREVCALAEELPRITVETEIPPFLYAPVHPGEEIGRVCYYLDGQLYASVPLTAQTAARELPPPESNGLWKKMLSFFSRLCNRKR